MSKGKRKAERGEKPSKHHKKSKSSGSSPPEERSTSDVTGSFRTGLFDKDVLKNYNGEYKSSGPYVSDVYRFCGR